MCGICGIVTLDGGPVRPDAIEPMTASLHHRGPDDRGTWSSQSVALGATRLSILDLSTAGHQPMTRGETTLAYNGEIYNFAAIRRRLESDGVVFRSHGDTEVVLEAIRAYGSDAFSMFDGMFTLAAWNESTHTLLLARDRFGIKPLYYARAGDELAFASEVRALLQWRPELQELREDAIDEYLMFRDVAGDVTLFRDVARVLPGEMIEIRNGNMRRTMWARHSCLARQECPAHTALKRSVADQLVADVPVGTLCSGGIDSGLITVLAARERTASLHTFSVAFPGFELDESQHALAVSRRAGATHHVLEANPRAFAEDYARLTAHHDEPLKFENAVFLYQICKMARDAGVIVLLAGEGADELFGGYSWLASGRKLARVRRWQSIPFAKRIRWGSVPLPARARNALYRMTADLDELILYSFASNTSSDVAALLGRPARDDFAYRRAVIRATRGQPLPDRMRAHDLAAYLPPILVRQDKMSMAASVETRVPMLGNEVAAAALSTPAADLVPKLPLRRIAEELLPPEVIHRRKIGFFTPARDWLRDDPSVHDLLSLLTANARISSVFDPRAVRRVVDENRSGLLWTLIALETWLRECKVRA